MGLNLQQLERITADVQANDLDWVEGRARVIFQGVDHTCTYPDGRLCLSYGSGCAGFPIPLPYLSSDVFHHERVVWLSRGHQSSGQWHVFL